MIRLPSTSPRLHAPIHLALAALPPSSLPLMQVLVAAASNLPPQKEARLGAMRPSALPGGTEGWARAIEAWRGWGIEDAEGAEGAGAECAGGPLKFRVTPKKGGPQEFATVELGQVSSRCVLVAVVVLH